MVFPVEMFLMRAGAVQSNKIYIAFTLYAQLRVDTSLCLVKRDNCKREECRHQMNIRTDGFVGGRMGH